MYRKKILNTYTTRSFAGEIVLDGGWKRVKIQAQTFYQHEINKFDVGTKVTMGITSKKPKRSEQQNRYYWGAYLPLIAKEAGETNIEKLHNVFKGEFLTTAIEEVKLPNGYTKKVRMIKSTTDLSVNDFSEYIMAIEQLTGVAAPPTENFDLAPLLEGIKTKDGNNETSKN